MRTVSSRRGALTRLVAFFAGLSSLAIARQAKAAVRQFLVNTGAPKGYDPAQHKWLMALDVERCIGCGLCVEACKKENHVPTTGSYYRTWVERYVIAKPPPGSAQTRGRIHVDSPDGGQRGFPTEPLPPDQIQHAFFVPKLCNLCHHSPCAQVCPVGATFDAPDGAVLVDSKYCIGCGFCIQACPYGCRFMNPRTRTAEKCTLCYHRITRGLRPACVEVCPTQARIFGDLMQPTPSDPIQTFFATHKVQGLKAHLGTEPRVVYAGLDAVVN
jgi:Fe-S-cluster-containing dehydrogenase component